MAVAVVVWLGLLVMVWLGDVMCCLTDVRMAVCDFVAVLVVGARRRGRAGRECALIWGFGRFDWEFGFDVVAVMFVVGV